MVLGILAIEQELNESDVVALDLQEWLEISTAAQVKFHVPEAAELGINDDIWQEHDPVH